MQSGQADIGHHDDEHEYAAPHPRGESGLWLCVIGLGLAWMTLFGLTWWLATQW
jgi:hypothetical protein